MEVDQNFEHCDYLKGTKNKDLTFVILIMFLMCALGYDY